MLTGYLALRKPAERCFLSAVKAQLRDGSIPVDLRMEMNGHGIAAADVERAALNAESASGR